MLLVMAVSEHRGERIVVIFEEKNLVLRLYDKNLNPMVQNQLSHGGKVFNFPMLNSTDIRHPVDINAN
jgi:hypothetical protein